MDLTKLILPYPYEAYSTLERIGVNFEEYKRKIYGWVENNSLGVIISENINEVFNLVKPLDENNLIKEWLLKHVNKLRYIGDFSGLAFGIAIVEETEGIELRYPYYIDVDDKDLYPGYDEVLFREMDVIAKLDWMHEHCEFIPFRVLYEDISLTDNKSHKFSHIKRDKWVMRLLDPYINGLQYQPSDEAYYFICFDSKTNTRYLKRDLDKSPKFSKRV